MEYEVYGKYELWKLKFENLFFAIEHFVLVQIKGWYGVMRIGENSIYHFKKIDVLWKKKGALRGSKTCF